MPAGRPTLFNKETCRMAREYIVNCKDKLGGPVPIVNLPKAPGMANWLGVNIDTLYEWAKVHPEFSDVLDELNQKQQEKLIDHGLAGNYNANIAKLVLGKHGYHDKSETEHSGQIKTSNVEQTPEVLAALAKLEDVLKKTMIK